MARNLQGVGNIRADVVRGLRTQLMTIQKTSESTQPLKADIVSTFANVGSALIQLSFKAKDQDQESDRINFTARKDW